MQIPFIILSYGNFSITKKLFSYERNGIHTLPVFTDAAKALCFSDAMTTILRELNDHRGLQAQLCTEPKMALAMFETVTAYCTDLMRIIINPLPPVRDNEEYTDTNHITWTEQFQDIDDVLEQLQDWVSADKETENDEPRSNVL